MWTRDDDADSGGGRGGLEAPAVSVDRALRHQMVDAGDTVALVDFFTANETGHGGSQRSEALHVALARGGRRTSPKVTGA